MPDMQSRLPDVGTTIFTVMSALAAQHDAVNLGQGFPDFDCDPALVDAVTRAMRDGRNQYPPMTGWPALRVAIADKIDAIYGHRYDADLEITVTAGATQAILTAVLALTQPGDEVIVIEPFYDSYVPAIRLAGAIPVSVRMHIGGTKAGEANAGFAMPWDAIRAAITPRTRMLIVNSPHNPTGMCMRESDLRELESIATRHDLVIVSDEVYEHMVYDGMRHESVSRYPALAARSIVISSFGKTFHVTGWKVGYAAAPRAMSDEFRKVHQFNVFTVNTPMQVAIAEYLADPTKYLDLAAFYQSRRDFFRDGLAQTRFRMFPVDGTYFQMVDIGEVRDGRSEDAFCKWLTTEVGVAAIPHSAFYETPYDAGLIRFCFAKKEETLARALERLAKV